MPQHYLSICAMFRDEAPYLEEWIAFHRDRGVEHFFLYDHGSSDGGAEKLRPFVEQGLVTLHPWPVKEKIQDQRAAYDHCLANHGATSRWIAFVDLDEFLFSPQGPLVEQLRRYEDYAGVFVFWQCYGSSGHREPPPGLVTDSYLKRAKSHWRRNQRGKSIVDPSRVISAVGPHHFVLKEGGQIVNEARQPVHFRMVGRTTKRIVSLLARWWPYVPGDAYSFYVTDSQLADTKVFRINHYVVKSWAEYVKKMHKNNATKRYKKRYSPRFFRYHDRNEVHDPVLQGSVRLPR